MASSLALSPGGRTSLEFANSAQRDWDDQDDVIMASWAVAHLPSGACPGVLRPGSPASNKDKSPKRNAREAPPMPFHVTARLILLACVSGGLFGIDLGSIGAALSGISRDLHLSTLQKEAVVSGVKGGAIFGCLVGGAWMAAYGRRHALAFTAVPFVVGPLFIGLATTFGEALVGRMVMGFGVGVASVAAPCYLSEVAPPQRRGRLVACYELALAVGYAVAALFNYAVELWGECPGGCWRYQSAVLPLLTALPLVLAVSILPESPLWLLLQAGCDAARLRWALQAISRLGSPDAKERLRTLAERRGTDVPPAELPWSASPDHLVAAWDRQHEAAGFPLFLSPEALAQLPEDAPIPVSAAKVLLRTVSDIFAVAFQVEGVPAGARRGLGLAVAAAILNQLCASTSIMMYAQHMLSEVGVGSAKTQDLMAMAVAFTKVLGVVLGMIVINAVDRRHLLGWGGAVGAVTLTFVAVGSASRNAVVLLIGQCSWILIFVATWGNGYWVVATEVTAPAGPRYISACQAAATSVLFAAGWLSSVTFISITEAGGVWWLMLYAGVAVLMALFAWFVLPETRGRTLEECAVVVRGGGAAAARGKSLRGGTSLEA